MCCKKILALIMALVMVFCLCSCNANTNTEVSQSQIKSEENSTSTTLSKNEETSKNDTVSNITSKKHTNTSSTKKNSSSSKKASSKDPSSQKEYINTSTPKNNSVSSKKETSTTTSKKVSSETTSKPKAQGPKLYKVTNDKGNVVWLFGSIHVGRESFYPLPDYVMDAFYNSDVLAVEFDIVDFEKDTALQTAALSKMISPNGSMQSHLTGVYAESIYSKAQEILINDDTGYLNYYMPVFWSNLIDNMTYEKIGVKTEYGVDRHLINKAKQKNIKIENIESAESQYKMLAGFSNEIQTMMLKNSIETYENPDAKKELENLMGLWEKGDYNQLGEIYNREFKDSVITNNFELYKEYSEAMYTDREHIMKNYIKNALKSGKEAFVCVGAAHLARALGIIEDLKIVNRSTYTIEEVN